MLKFFHLISELTTLQQAVVALCIVAVMTGIPYYGFMVRILLLLFRRQLHAEVHRFDWNAVDHESSNRSFYIEGTALVLRWDVEGAYRIDVQPIGRRLKGNAAEIVITSGLDTFILTAYGLSGKVQVVRTLPQSAIKQLHVTALSRNVSAATAHKSVVVQSYTPKTKVLDTVLARYGFIKGALHRLEPRFSRLTRTSYVGSLALRYKFTTRKYQKVLDSEKI